MAFTPFSNIHTLYTIKYNMKKNRKIGEHLINSECLMNNMVVNKGVTLMKDQKLENMIFDEEGEAIVRQQLLDSYYDGTTDTQKNQDKDNQDSN
jgi:hypothetical protein